MVKKKSGLFQSPGTDLVAEDQKLKVDRHTLSAVELFTTMNAGKGKSDS